MVEYRIDQYGQTVTEMVIFKVQKSRINDGETMHGI